MEQQTEAIVCQLCREPIWNFLCVDCLSDNVSKWMPKTLTESFEKFNENIRSYIHTTPDNYEPCLKCDLLNETSICPHCYTHETFHWLKTKDSELAASFSKMFFFYNFEGAELFSSNALPITESKNNPKDTGSCDNCGKESDYLNNLEGEWYCETCRDETEE